MQLVVFTQGPFAGGYVGRDEGSSAERNLFLYVSPISVLCNIEHFSRAVDIGNYFTKYQHKPSTKKALHKYVYRHTNCAKRLSAVVTATIFMETHNGFSCHWHCRPRSTSTNDSGIIRCKLSHKNMVRPTRVDSGHLRSRRSTARCREW
jgi:hypothetical protein